MNVADPATQLELHEAADTRNILLEPKTLGRRRPSMAAFSLTSGPTSNIEQLVRYQPAVTKTTGIGGVELWAFSGTTSLYEFANSAWNNITVSDTATAWTTSRPYGATFNGKLFLAYDSNVNRLHVYDGTVVRRVGIESSAAATVANTGAGAYAATLRYYKIQFRIYSGSNQVATSELSASVSFTPSGAGTDARITKPTTPDSATHWVVYGSPDNVTFYGPVVNATFTDGLIPVATTTFDDRTTVSAYSALTVAPSVGLNVPPPAAKYLLATDNRLFMAGCWETSATSKQTGTRNSRVWFTDVLGARDNTGEDESIPQTIDTKLWIDCGENDGDAIVGLGGPIDGAIFVFKARSIWRLTPTGLFDAPYRADRITSAIGATWQDAIALGEDGGGNPALYFHSLTGPKRIAQGYGIEDIGADLRDYSSSTYSRIPVLPILVWDAVRRVMLWAQYQSTNAWAYQPQFETRSADGVRGGWTQHSISIGATSNEINALATYPISDVETPVLGGRYSLGPTAYLASWSGSGYQDVGPVSLSSYVKSGVWSPAGPDRRCAFQQPLLEWLNVSDSLAHGMTVASVVSGPTAVLGSVSDTVSGTPGGTIARERLEGVQLSDVLGLQVTVTWDSTVDGSARPPIYAAMIPVSAQEPV